MKGPRSEKVRLLHMLDAADRLISEHQKLNGQRLTDEDFLFLAFVRLVEVIGEAAYQLSRDFRARYPEIPWRPIIAMRHIVVHEYDNLDESLVWDVIENYLPPLRLQLQVIIDSLPE